MKPTNLDDYKNLKKVEIMYIDLLEAVGAITASIESLKKYSKYTPVNESLSALHNSRTILEIHINKFRKVLAK